LLSSCFLEFEEWSSLHKRDRAVGNAQVNASPSLATDTVADFHLKFAMVDAALSLTDVEGTFGGKPPASLNGFDLIWENGAPVQV
jgi:hypothetical protein